METVDGKDTLHDTVGIVYQDCQDETINSARKTNVKCTTTRKPVAILNGSSIKKKSDLVYVWFGVTDPPVLFGGSQNTDK